MELADRIELIKKLAHGLDELPWPEVTLILMELGVEPESSGAVSDSYQYCLWHLREVSDEGLAQLDRYLGGESLPAVGDGPDIWGEGYVRAFLSHLSSDKAGVAQVRDELTRYGIAGFVAHTDIEPSRAWVRVIESALQSCDVLVAFLRGPKADEGARGFRDSNWCDQEVGWAAGRGVPLIPLDFGMKPYGFLGQYQAIISSGLDIPGLAERIFLAVKAREELRPKLFDALVKQLVVASSYPEAIEAAKLVEKHVNDWPEHRLRELRQSLENDQVSTSAGAHPVVMGILADEEEVPF